MGVQKLKLNVEILLGQEEASCVACEQRLRELLETNAGVGRAHLTSEAGSPQRICIHFDPEQISVAELRRLARKAGAALDQRYGHAMFWSRPMHASRARLLETELQARPGVVGAGVSADGVIRIEFDRQATSAARLRSEIVGRDLPYLRTAGSQSETSEDVDSLSKDEPHSHVCGHHDHGHGGLFGERTELVFSLLCGAALLIGWLISFSAAASWIPLACFGLAYFFGGYYVLLEATQKIRFGQFEIDFLMIVAAIGAAVLGHWSEGALLLFLFSLGHALEHYAMGQARRAIESLADLAPQTATVRRDGGLQEVAVTELSPGDIVLVKPHDRIAADGVVVKGASSVDQSPITGESVPVEKRAVENFDAVRTQPDLVAPEHKVFAGTINENRVLEIAVTRRASDSTIARVVRMVNEAETHKSPTQRFTDRFERIFVPAVIAVVVLLLFAFVVVEESFADSFYRAMAVLVAASPCALAISTPSAVLSGIARAARGGVLIKGGGPLENLGHVRTIAFDKTGTLTIGKPALTDVITCEGVEQDELLRLAVAVESLSDHPLARAVVKAGRQKLAWSNASRRHDVRDFHSVTGRGVEAVVDGENVFIGKDGLFAKTDGHPLPSRLQESVRQLEQQGRTTMIVREGDRYLGVLGVMDTVRKEAAATVQRLRELGVEQFVMISGDNQQVAEAIASQVGITDARGGLLPEDKVSVVRRIRKQQAVAMVGDGVNDAPALANACVGIAMGAAGSDVALETADVALMADNLSHLPFAVGLSRQTSRIIQQNLWFSLGMVAILVPATILGLQMGLAVLFHEGSTLVVVFNALRLLVYDESGDKRSI